MKKFIFIIFATGIFYCLALWESYQSLYAFQSANLPQAAQHAQTAQPIVRVFSFLHLKQHDLFEAWDSSLKLIIEAEALRKQYQLFLNGFFINQAGLSQEIPFQPSQQISTQSSQEILTRPSQQILIQQAQLDQHFQSWQTKIYQLKIFKSAFLAEKFQFLNSAIKDWQTISQDLLTGEKQILVLLQNSQEIRATGGFLGSYAYLKINNGQLTEFYIRDIYEPAGRDQAFQPAPPGLKEYLSGGQGMRLPDANWSADFPSSAQTISQYFQVIDQLKIDQVIAVNSPVIKEIIRIFQPIKIPNYQTAITADNFEEIAREERNKFFPGSQQKTNILNALFNQIKFRLTDLQTDEEKAVLTTLLTAMKQKNLIFYAAESQIQAIYEKYQLADLLASQQPFLLYLVESNVGINKANQAVNRQVKVEISDYRSMITIDFSNHNQVPIKKQAVNPYVNEADHLAYVNYQRVFFLPNQQLYRILLNGQPIQNYDLDVVKNIYGQEFSQLGFLITIAEQKNAQLVIELVNQDVFSPDNQLMILKQPGLPTVDYQISYNGKEEKISLESDQLIKF